MTVFRMTLELGASSSLTRWSKSPLFSTNCGRNQTVHIIGNDEYFKSVNLGDAPPSYRLLLVCSSYVPSLVQLQIDKPSKRKERNDSLILFFFFLHHPLLLAFMFFWTIINLCVAIYPSSKEVGFCMFQHLFKCSCHLLYIYSTWLLTEMNRTSRNQSPWLWLITEGFILSLKDEEKTKGVHSNSHIFNLWNLKAVCTLLPITSN